MNTGAETIRPGIAWNATRVASVLIVVLLAVIALTFWPAFETSDSEAPLTRQTNGLAAPHQLVVVSGDVCAQCRPVT